MGTNGQFKVESGIPLPEGNGGGRLPKYPWTEMNVGDSFPVPESQRKTVKSAATAYCNSRKHLRFTVRKDANGDYRCWRVA